MKDRYFLPWLYMMVGLTDGEEREVYQREASRIFTESLRAHQAEFKAVLEGSPELMGELKCNRDLVTARQYGYHCVSSKLSVAAQTVVAQLLEMEFDTIPHRWSQPIRFVYLDKTGRIFGLTQHGECALFHGAFWAYSDVA